MPLTTPIHIVRMVCPLAAVPIHIVLIVFHLTPWWLSCLTMLAFRIMKSPGKKWTKEKGKYNRLKNDVQKTFEHDTGIQILLISEFGHMFNRIVNAAEILTTLLAELDLTHIHFEAMAPYVALIDKN